MSSLNITTEMKATLLRVVAVAGSQGLVLLVGPLLKLFGGHVHWHIERERTGRENGPLLHVLALREFHYEGQYIFDTLIFLPFICFKNNIFG